MNRLSVAAAIIVATYLPCAGAVADEDGTVAPGPTGFIVSLSEDEPGADIPASDTSISIIATYEDPACALGGSQTCAEGAVCDDGQPMIVTTFLMSDGSIADGGTSCPPDARAPDAGSVTPGMVAAAFRRIPLPEAKLVIQPPNGRTLVNFKTNFYTEQGEFTRTVTLLGRQVELRIWPASFGWRFGDGESDQTTSPGAAYPDLEITHEYLSKGRVSPSVDTTYAAQFRVGQGPWRDVAGTVTIPGSPQALRVVEARPVLVGG